MTVNRRSKNSRQRGSWTHGGGAKKKRRGSGHRGGHGFSGTGKKASQKKPSVWNPRHIGKYGFKKKGIVKDVNTVNLEYLNKLSLENKIKDSINLKDLGFNKLLGKGKLTKKLKIIVESASEKAVQRVKAAGGEVLLPKVERAVEKIKKEE